MAVATKRRVMALALCAAAAILPGCTTYNPPARAFHEATIQPYTLDSGDRLRVTVFEQEGLTNTYTVDQAGYIAFPLIGQVAVRGLTLPKVEKLVAQKLQQGYLRNPDVSIEVDRCRSVCVMGDGGQSGQYTYVPGMNVQNAIAIAGGFSTRASMQNVDITRKINGQILTGRVPITDPVMAGDTIYVRERLF